VESVGKTVVVWYVTSLPEVCIGFDIKSSIFTADVDWTGYCCCLNFAL